MILLSESCAGPERVKICWTRAKLKLLKSAYKKAVKEGKSVFQLDEHDFVVGYAKYLIQYLDNQLK